MHISAFVIVTLLKLKIIKGLDTTKLGKFGMLNIKMTDPSRAEGAFSEYKVEHN